MKCKIFGQDEAIDLVVRQIKRSKSGLDDREKPIASCLFVGPTGTGKTELCKQLSEQFNIPLIRFDMSEYQEKGSVAKLIGSVVKSRTITELSATCVQAELEAI